MMNPIAMIPLMVLLLIASASAQTDRVRTYSGSETGTITAISPMSITIDRNGREKQIAVGEIRTVQFGDEPSELTQARANALSGAYGKALELIGKVDTRNGTNPNVLQELAYFTAYSNAKLALLGEGELAEAGRQLSTFVKKNRDSFHRLEAEVLLGDLYASVGKYDAAQRKYELLAKTPWPSYKIRSAVLVGNALQAQGQHDQAIAKYDQAISIQDDSPQAASQQQAALLGKAVSLAASGKLEQGAGLVRSVINQADPKEQALHAAAYNALGGCYLKAGHTKDALFAYLHVDLLYPTMPEAHAEALYHLSSLWEEVGKSNEARQARETLKSKYAATSWAKK